MIAQAVLTIIALFHIAGVSVPAEYSVAAQGPRRIHDTQSVGIDITGSSAVVVDAASGVELWSKNPYTIQPIASITKLITALVLLEETMHPHEVVTMQRSDQRAVGGNRHLYFGEQVRIEDLFHASLIASDNEAVAALVRVYGYSEEEFVIRANEWLSVHGFEHTHMADPTGLEAGNVSTAHEVAQLAEIAFSNEFVSAIVAQQKYSFAILNSGRQVHLDSTNELLPSIFGVEHGKTGFTSEAGYCLTTRSKMPGGADVITVVLGADSLQNRFQDTKAMVYWVQQNYSWE